VWTLCAQRRLAAPPRAWEDWGGAISTDFWVDLQQELIGVFMTQLMPSGTYPVVDDFRVAVYQAIVD
jgi:hypothetical protein